ncbi:MAG TPA: hypothetical protein VM095_08650 [Pyrinomonadaceae bacterium]|nr:hypothetical protein [Pyrinomonadaceae bacterium]
MMKKIAIKHLLLILFVFCLSPVASGQNLSAYLDEHIAENVKARIDQTDPTKQSETPAAAQNSTSLVERSSAPDLAGLGLDFLNLSDASSSDKKSATPKTLTFSSYALKSLMSNEDPLDPEIYNRNKNWRSVSFTLGYEVPENTNDRDPIIGLKWLAYNGRDLSNTNNQAEISKIQTALNPASSAFAAIFDDVRLYLFIALKKRGKLPTGGTTQALFEGQLASAAGFPTILNSLTDDEKKNVDQIISKYISAFVNLDAVSKSVVKTIRSRPQLALQFTTTQRKGKRPDEYSTVLTFDKGMGTSSMTLNGSFIYKNNRTGSDSRGARFAAGIHMPLQGFKPLGYSDPLLLSLEANATAMTGETPMYKAQARLTIPFPNLPGVEIPISVSVANRTEFVKEKEVKGKFGFTFDISKALKAFRDSFQKRVE